MNEAAYRSVVLSSGRRSVTCRTWTVDRVNH